MEKNCVYGRRRIKDLLFVAWTIAGAVLGSGSCSLQDDSGKAESINLGVLPVAVAALVHIAEDQRFFAANGLRIKMKDYETGTASTDALLKGEVDLAWVAEFPFVKKALGKERISIIAVIGRFNEQILFALKDRGITRAADLKGKRIGIPRNTIAEFYLGRFLELNGLDIRDVSLVDVAPSRAMDAILRGGIDGVIVWEPHSSRIRARLADRATAFPVQSSQPGYGVITGRNDWIAGHPKVVTRFLESLAQAEAYVNRDPDSAKSILQKKLKYEDAFMETIWSENQFSLSLDPSLIAAMEDEARWMIKNEWTDEKTVPNFLEYIYVDGLKAAKPEAVRMIR